MLYILQIIYFIARLPQQVPFYLHIYLSFQRPKIKMFCGRMIYKNAGLLVIVVLFLVLKCNSSRIVGPNCKAGLLYYTKWKQ